MKRYAQMIYMLSQCKDAIDNPAARMTRITRRELSVWGVSTRELRGLKNLNFGGYSCRVNQSGACSSSDVIMSGGRKSKSGHHPDAAPRGVGETHQAVCASEGSDGPRHGAE